jgi:serine protease Do
MRRRTALRVAVVSALVSAVVSSLTTVAVIRLTDPAPEPVVRDLAGSATATAATAGGAADGGLDLAALFDRVAGGVLRVETTACVLGGSGSGFLVDDDLVATAAHVVDGAHTIVLRRDDGTGVPAAVVGLDTVHDVALLRADRALEGHVFRFADAVPPVGADVAALGYPLAGPLVPVRRTVTGVGQSLDVSGTTTPAGPDTLVENLLRVDGGFRRGDSGGPVLDARGRVVGLVEGRSTQDPDVGYAVSATRAAPLVDAWRGLGTSVDVSDSCAAPVGPPQARVVVRDESTEGLGGVVADLFGAYASAINSARYEDAWALLGAGARGGQTYEEWVASERSSQIFDAVVVRVQVLDAGTAPTTATPSPAAPTAGATAGRTTVPLPVVTPGEGGRLAALVEFSSTQEDRLGPAGQTCSRWRLTYTLRRADGVWTVGAAALAPGFPQAC